MVARVNAQLPEERQRWCAPLTYQRTAGARKTVGEGTTKEINPLIGLEALDRGLRKTNTGTGSYGELSNQLYADFQLFAGRLMDGVLQAQGDPRAGRSGAITRGYFFYILLHRLEAAKKRQLNDLKVQTPMRRKTQSR